MKEKKYRLPLQFSKVLNREHHSACSNVGESIAQNLHLILLTSFGDHRYNRSYGCSIWENDFEVIPQIKKWQKDISKSLKGTVELHERRLTRIKVSVSIDQEEFLDPMDQKIKRIKKRIKVEINAKLKKTNEDFRFADTIYYSPVSLD